MVRQTIITLVNSKSIPSYGTAMSLLEYSYLVVLYSRRLRTLVNMPSVVSGHTSSQYVYLIILSLTAQTVMDVTDMLRKMFVLAQIRNYWRKWGKYQWIITIVYYNTFLYGNIVGFILSTIKFMLFESNLTATNLINHLMIFLLKAIIHNMIHVCY